MAPVLKPVLKYLQQNLQHCFTHWLVLTFFSVSKSQTLFWLELKSLKLLGKITGCRGGQQGAVRPGQQPVSPLAWSAQPASRRNKTDLSRTACCEVVLCSLHRSCGVHMPTNIHIPHVRRSQTHRHTEHTPKKTKQ